jgi:hypothetical protein
MHFSIKHLWITCSLLFVSFFIGCTQEVVVPQYLIGEWKTSSPQYEDRYLKFDAKTLTYGIGEGAEVSHTIDKIDVEQGSGGTLYSFHYKDADGETSTLTLTYKPEGTIQIKNKSEIWAKVNPQTEGQ